MHLNLYVHKDNQPHLSKTDNPTGLINLLLRAHFNASDNDSQPQQAQEHAPILAKPSLIVSKVTNIESQPANDGRLYSVVVEANGVQVRKNMTLAVAEDFLAGHNFNGDMAIVEQKGKL